MYSIDFAILNFIYSFLIYVCGFNKVLSYYINDLMDLYVLGELKCVAILVLNFKFSWWFYRKKFN